MTKQAPLLIVLALAIALIAIPTRSQDSDPDPSETEIYTEAIDVEVINIDVYVTDKNGEPVHGLTKGDDWDVCFTVIVSNNCPAGARIRVPLIQPLYQRC